MSKEEKKKSGVLGSTLKWIFIILVLSLFGSSLVITHQNEYSVIKQFGSIKRVESEPGLSFKIPFIQQVKYIDKKLLFYDIAASSVITSDKKTMIVDAYVIWKVDDPILYLSSLSGSKTNAEGRINTVVYNAIKNTISNMSQNAVILSRDGKINVSDIDEQTITNDIVVTEDDDETPDVIEIESLTDKIMDNLSDTSQYGISIQKTEVKILDLPDDNKQAVYERMISERNNVAATYKAQGEAEAQIIKNTTDKEISITLSTANAEAEKIIAEGEAEYMKILSKAYNDESKAEFYTFVRSLDTAKESLKGSKDNVLILDANSPITQIFYNR